MNGLDIMHGDLEVDASSVRMCKFGLRKESVATERLFKHQFGPFAFQVEEALFRALVDDGEAQDIAVEGTAARKIEADEFGSESR